MTVTDAVSQANTEHIVYFLLTAYVEALGYTGRSSMPPPAEHLPIVTRTDVNERLRVLREALASASHRTPDSKPLIEEAAGLFSAASERLEKIAEAGTAIAVCNAAAGSP